MRIKALQATAKSGPRLSAKPFGLVCGGCNSKILETQFEIRHAQGFHGRGVRVSRPACQREEDSMKWGHTVVATMAGVMILAHASPGRALDTCKAKVNPKDGTILVSGKGVGANFRWGYAAGQETNVFSNGATCVSGDVATKCELGAEGTAERITPPALCSIYLADDVPSTCVAFITKCTPGLRGVNGSSARAYASTGQILSAPAKVSLDAETFDRLGEFSTSTSTFTALQAGFYSVSASVVVEDLVCAAQVFAVRKNGVAYSEMKYVANASPDQNNPRLHVTDIVELAVGDTLELWLEAAPGCANVSVFGGGTSDLAPFMAIGRLP
jgi:hypothetical protein